MLMATSTRRFRALFISDVHLGAKGCQAERLLDFMRDHDADVIYLVGDIVDGWQLRSGWYWPQAHNDVVQKLLRQARNRALQQNPLRRQVMEQRVKPHLPPDA